MIIDPVTGKPLAVPMPEAYVFAPNRACTNDELTMLLGTLLSQMKLVFSEGIANQIGRELFTTPQELQKVINDAQHGADARQSGPGNVQNPRPEGGGTDPGGG